ncbi:hypothetical protein [Nitrosospira multiformis]|uniref:hypothetical protein n=1 Tax=Nitrosospira multiformis TaxID=1231 RepID=UPI0011B03C7F|nr:hypothetical protein [Nitrosospira multiformis]
MTPPDFQFSHPPDKGDIDSCVAGDNRVRPRRAADSRMTDHVRMTATKKVERQKLPAAVGILPVGLHSPSGFVIEVIAR